MIPMGFVICPGLPRVAMLVAALSLLACRETEQEKPIRGDRSVRPLDGMERFAARSVSLETAITAMEERDLKKLQMLSVWVKNRDKTVLIEPDDLRALDLAIECLERKLTPDERKKALNEVKPCKLKPPAQKVCIEDAR